MIDHTDFKKAARLIRLLGWFKIPMIGYCRPRLVEFDDNKMVVKIGLRRRTRNHFKTMYFGALSVGTDLSGGFGAFYMARKQGIKLSLVFKDFRAEFIKRPDADVYFVSNNGAQVKRMIESTRSSGERVTEGIKIQAYTHYPHQPELVAEFELGLSIKAINQ